MGLHRPKPNVNKGRAPDELWWDNMMDGHVVMQGKSHIRGWLLILDGKFVARNENGTVRAEFDTYDEAKEFLWAIVNMEGSK